jgi:putative methyltransferase
MKTHGTEKRFSSSPYNQAAQILNELWESKNKSLKRLLYDSKSGDLKCSKSCYAQVSNVTQRKDQLDDILRETKLLDAGKNKGLLYVMVFELLFGPNRAIQGGGVLKRIIMKQADVLKETAVRFPQDDAKVFIRLPRYARVNTLTTTTQTIVDRLVAEQATEHHHDVYLDPHVPDLLVVAPEATASFIRMNDSSVVLQDKSSCFSALCLARGWSDLLAGDYIDACAAPGNKTLHLAALLGASSQGSANEIKAHNKTDISTIYAFDRSGDRFRILEKRIDQYCATTNSVKVVPQHQDCLAIQAEDYASVQCVLLDPTCSGSGVVNASHNNNHNDSDESALDSSSNQRIETLSNFQVTCLKQFMSFPNVQRIVYSTCSLHIQENEHVISQVLLDSEASWRVHAPICLQHWQRRGQPVQGLSIEQTNAMIRVDPKMDETNGFFVCCLERHIQETKRTSTTKKSNSRPNSEKWIQKQSVQLGIPLYSGQLRSSSSPALKQTTTAVIKEPTLSQTKSHSDIKSKKPTTTTSSEKAIVLPTKVAKRLAWKRKQKESKQRRLEEKKKGPKS